MKYNLRGTVTAELAADRERFAGYLHEQRVRASLDVFRKFGLSVGPDEFVLDLRWLEECPMWAGSEHSLGDAVGVTLIFEPAAVST